MNTAKPISAELAQVIQDHISKGGVTEVEVLDSPDARERNEAKIFMTNCEVRHYKNTVCKQITYYDNTSVEYSEDGTIIRERVYASAYSWEGFPVRDCMSADVRMNIDYLPDGTALLFLMDNHRLGYFGTNNPDGSYTRRPIPTLMHAKDVHFDAGGRRIRDDFECGGYCLHQINGDKEYFQEGGSLYGIKRANGTHERYENGKLTWSETQEQRNDAKEIAEREAKRTHNWSVKEKYVSPYPNDSAAAKKMLADFGQAAPLASERMIIGEDSKKMDDNAQHRIPSCRPAIAHPN